ncbi:MAG TPA: thiamine phosphate synthase [Xanthobacteraceae bacterium]|nr:thiamine phosphate synthase [Xanthobacteraceae bacterium]
MVDLRLYALLDPERAGGHELAELGREVAAGGATLVQLRDKHGSTRRLIAETRAIKAALASSGVPVLVNDRVDVALAAGADGVHVGQDDMPAADARRLLGPAAVIGLSVKTIAQAEAAPLEALDYVCVGGVFVTASKDNVAAPIGLAGLKTILAVLRGRAPDFPVGAIAGIDETNAGEVVAAGADGVAVISALSLAPDPAGAAKRLRGMIDRSLRARVAS